MGLKASFGCCGTRRRYISIITSARFLTLSQPNPHFSVENNTRHPLGNSGISYLDSFPLTSSTRFSVGLNQPPADAEQCPSANLSILASSQTRHSHCGKCCSMFNKGSQHKFARGTCIFHFAQIEIISTSGPSSPSPASAHVWYPTSTGKQDNGQVTEGRPIYC